MITQNKSILNWKDFFKSENLLTDALKFRDWDQKNLEISEKETLIKDLTRTRNDDPFFKKESTQRNMKLLATFYCQQNSVNYQQGMLELVAPFLVLKNVDFPIQKCYAYFNYFMNTYFPKVLEFNILKGEKHLAHVLSAIKFSDILLKYHCADFYCKILSIEGFETSMVVTPLIMTLFLKGTDMKFVFLILDEYMKRHNQNFIFYMIPALFLLQKEDILSIPDQEELLMYLNKKLKNFTSENDILNLFDQADQLYAQTPESYERIIAQTSFHDKILSQEDIEELANCDQSYFTKYLILDLKELKELLGKSQKQSVKKLDFVIIDIRKKRKLKLKEFIPKKFIVKTPNSKQHTCLITDSNQNIEEAIKLADQYFKEGVNHISILKGGFKEIQAKIAQQKDCQIF